MLFRSVAGRSFWDAPFMGEPVVSLGAEIPVVGPVLVCLSPLNLAVAAVAPARALGQSMLQPDAIPVSMLVGGALAVAVYAGLTWAMLAAIRRSFMMTVRRLAGLK